MRDDVAGQDTDRGHVQLAEYEPEMVYLGRLDREYETLLHRHYGREGYWRQ